MATKYELAIVLFSRSKLRRRRPADEFKFSNPCKDRRITNVRPMDSVINFNEVDLDKKTPQIKYS